MSPKRSISLRLSVAVNARGRCRWVLRWLRSKKMESLKRFSGTNATAVHMVLILKRGREVCRFAPMPSIGGGQINLAEVVEETLLWPLTIENRTSKDALAMTAALLATYGQG